MGIRAYWHHLLVSGIVIVLVGGCSQGPAQDVFTAHVLRGHKLFDRGEFAGASKEFRKAEQVTDGTPPRQDSGITLIKGVMAASPALATSIDVWEKVVGKEHEFVLTGLLELAFLRYADGQEKLAGQALEKALSRYTAAGAPDNADVQRWLKFIHDLFAARGELDRAEQFYRRLLAIEQKTRGDGSRAVARRKLDVACDLVQRQRFPEAEALVRQAVEAADGLGPDAWPLQVETRVKLAEVFAPAGRYLEAERCFEAARERAIEHKGDLFDLYTWMGQFYNRYGSIAEARDCYSRALELKEQESGGTPQQVADALHNVLNVVQSSGDYQAALPLCNRFLNDYLSRLGAASPELIHVLNHQARIDMNLNETARAAAALDWGIAINKFQSSTAFPRVHDMLLSAGALSSLGDLSRARRLVDETVKMARGATARDDINFRPETFLATALKGKADWTARHLADAATAARCYDAAVEALRAGKLSDDLIVARCLYEKCSVLLDGGLYNEAQQSAAEARSLYCTLLGRKSLMVAELEARRARAAAALASWKLAGELTRQSLSVARLGEKNDPAAACQVLLELGRYGLESGDLSFAGERFAEVLALKKRHGPEADLAISLALDGQSQVAARSGKPAEALQLASAAAAAVLQSADAPAGESLSVLLRAAQLARLQGKEEQAKSWLIRARALSLNWHGLDHKVTREIDEMLARGKHERPPGANKING